MREFSVHSLKNVVRAAGVRVMISGADIHVYNISYILPDQDLGDLISV